MMTHRRLGLRVTLVALALLLGARHAAASCLGIGATCAVAGDCCSNNCASSQCAYANNNAPMWSGVSTGSTGYASAPSDDTSFNPSPPNSYSYVAQGSNLVAIRNVAEDAAAAGTLAWAAPWHTSGTPATIQSFPSAVPLPNGMGGYKEFIFVAANDGFLYKVDASTGVTATSVDTRRSTCNGAGTGDQVIATPTVQLYQFADAAFRNDMDAHQAGDSLVFVITRTQCSDFTRNRVIAYYASNLAVKWTFNSDGRYQVDYGSEGCSLDYSTDILYCGTHQSDTATANNSLFALPTIGNGSVAPIWSASAGSILNRPQLDPVSHRLYVSTANGLVTAYDPAGNGSGGANRLWTTPVNLGAAVTRNMWPEFRMTPDGQMSGRLVIVDGNGKLRMLQDTGTSARTVWGPILPYDGGGVTYTSMPVVIPVVDGYTLSANNPRESILIGTSNGNVEPIDFLTGAKGNAAITVAANKTIYDPTLDAQNGATTINRIIVANSGGTVAEYPLPNLSAQGVTTGGGGSGMVCNPAFGDNDCQQGAALAPLDAGPCKIYICQPDCNGCQTGTCVAKWANPPPVNHNCAETNGCQPNPDGTPVNDGNPRTCAYYDPALGAGMTTANFGANANGNCAATGTYQNSPNNDVCYRMAVYNDSYADNPCTATGDKACGAGQTCCGNSICSDLSNDPTHCGSCSIDCTSNGLFPNAQCVSGLCAAAGTCVGPSNSDLTAAAPNLLGADSIAYDYKAGNTCEAFVATYRTNPNTSSIKKIVSGGGVTTYADAAPGDFTPMSYVAVPKPGDQAFAGFVGAAMGGNAYAGRDKVLLVGSEGTAAWYTDVQSKLQATGRFAQVDVFDAKVGTPTVAQLQAYQAVLVWSDFNFFDSTTLGNNLATYYDGGGRVVVATFGDGGPALAGTFGTVANGYMLIDDARGQTSSYEPATLIIVETGTALVENVATFTSTSGYRSAGGAVNGGVVVAKWGTSQAPLIVRGVVKGRPRVDLNFYPVSSTQRGDFWVGDGATIMANALLYPKPRALLVTGETNASWNTDVQNKLLGTGAFANVDIFNANGGTPTLAQLQQYETVLVYNDSGFNNSAALGNNLASYQSAGGKVVVAAFADMSVPLAGTFGASDMLQTATGQQQPTESAPLIFLDRNNPIVSNVQSLTATSAYQTTGSDTNGGTTVVEWGTSGRPLAVTGKINGYWRADLNMFPPSVSSRSDFWSGNGDLLMKNALTFGRYSESFTTGVTPSTQCTNWNNFRSSLKGVYNSITIRGSNDPTGVSCVGSQADVLCQALHTATTATGITCGGRTWNVTTSCIPGQVELSADGNSCSCDGQGYDLRPCITNGNWGGVKTATCNGPTQTMTVDCEMEVSVAGSGPGLAQVDPLPGSVIHAAPTATLTTGMGPFTTAAFNTGPVGPVFDYQSYNGTLETTAHLYVANWITNGDLYRIDWNGSTWVPTAITYPGANATRITALAFERRWYKLGGTPYPKDRALYIGRGADLIISDLDRPGVGDVGPIGVDGSLIKNHGEGPVSGILSIAVHPVYGDIYMEVFDSSGAQPNSHLVAMSDIDQTTRNVIDVRMDRQIDDAHYPPAVPASFNNQGRIAMTPQFNLVRIVPTIDAAPAFTTYTVTHP